MLKHLDQRRRDDEGFTLIELMVVVLILGILMAIAIPTFLSTTKSAKNVAAESNATNAMTDEVSYYSTNSAFQPSVNGSTLDSALPWDTAADTTLATPGGAGKLLAQVGEASGTVGAALTVGISNAVPTAPAVANFLVLESLSSNDYCYVAVDDQSLATPEVGYFVDNAGCPPQSDFADSPAAGTPTTGSASKNAGAWMGTYAWGSFYSTF